MKEWFVGFWKDHGERMVFIIIAISMAAIFMLFPDLRETGKTILIGVAMLMFNKARSPKEGSGEPWKSS